MFLPYLHFACRRKLVKNHVSHCCCSLPSNFMRICTSCSTQYVTKCGCTTHVMLTHIQTKEYTMIWLHADMWPNVTTVFFFFLWEWPVLLAEAVWNDKMNNGVFTSWKRDAKDMCDANLPRGSKALWLMPKLDHLSRRKWTWSKYWVWSLLKVQHVRINPLSNSYSKQIWRRVIFKELL